MGLHCNVPFKKGNTEWVSKVVPSMAHIWKVLSSNPGGWLTESLTHASFILHSVSTRLVYQVFWPLPWLSTHVSLHTPPFPPKLHHKHFSCCPRRVHANVRIALKMSTIAFISIHNHPPIWRYIITGWVVGKALHERMNWSGGPPPKKNYLHSLWSRDSAVGIATGYWLGDREIEVRVPVGSVIFTSPCRPDTLWGPPSLVSNGYRGLFPGGKAAEAWNWPLTN
jgi:hypothetical protein